MRLPDMITECSTSLLTTSQSSPIALNGPMKLSTMRVPGPIATGPRIVELTTSAPSEIDDAAVDHGALVDLAVDALLDPLEQEPVGLEQRGELPGVDPPAAEQLAAHLMAVVDQPLDGVGDLEFAAR